MPCFRKKEFIRKFYKWPYIINDFFVSDFDTFVNDRQEVAPDSFRAKRLYVRDWLNFKLSKFILFDSNAHFQYISSLFGKTKAKVHILPVLANRQIYYPSSNDQSCPSKKVRVLFFGTFIPLHGLDKIVDAAKLVLDIRNDITFKIIGKGQTLPIIKKKMYKLNLPTSNFTLHEVILPEEELRKEILAADIILGIFGSSKKAQSVIPNKVYQGLACKKCVLTMESPAIKELFNEEQIAITRSRPDLIAQTIIKLADSVNVRIAFANEGYQKFINLYDSVKLDFNTFLSIAEQETEEFVSKTNFPCFKHIWQSFRESR